ncbi:hypothetical protein GCM10009740_14270 [Terrabacter terrae]|uniref:Uncharacterized protein n=1 Tax=Terrabacter terrae TaxID=318434 RepID=A0ABN2U1M5_9MICO
MGLTQWLARQAVRRCSVLLVEMPGGWRARVYAERFVLGRGWQLADSPAGADMLVVCGQLPPDLEDSVEAVWEQLPGPRVRISLAPGETEQGVEAAVEAALPHLRDTAAQREDAAGRSLPGGMDPGDMDPGDMDHGDMDHGDMDHGDMDHGDMDHGDMDHGDMDHGDMDHGDMDMAPDGIALAEGADDRDGLEMDELHLRLGPVLRHWPAGLEMTWTLHGDLVTEAEGRWIGSATGESATQGLPSTALLADAVRDVLQLAGWTEGAERAMRVRDLAVGSLAGRGDADLAREAAALVRRVRRSRTLRWSLRGLGRVERGWLDDHQLPSWWAGDANDRLLALLDAVHVSTDAGPGPDVLLERPDAAHLTRLCTGVEVAAARLVVASLAPHLGSLEAMRAGAHA